MTDKNEILNKVHLNEKDGNGKHTDILSQEVMQCDLPCGLVVRVPDYRSRGPCSIPGAAIFSEK
jgi:hypothetical protein